MPFYFHRETLSIDSIPPGRRIGAPAAFAICAALGLAFVVFLPAAGFGLLLWSAATRAFGHRRIRLKNLSA